MIGSGPLGAGGRRRRPALVAVAAALALVAGCGSGSTTSGSAAPPAEPPAAGGAFPVTIAHTFGEATIPAEPQRIVTLGFTDQDAVLALGAVPVATAEWYGEQPGALFPWAAEKLGGRPLPTVLPTADQVPFEQIAALRPDLILSLYGGLAQADYDRLSQIAPTVTQPAGVPNYSIPWDVQTEIVGKALGRSEQAADLIEGVRADIAAVKAEHPEFAGRTALTAGWFSDQWYVYSSKDQRGRLLTELGFTVPAEIDQLSGEKFGTYVSFERADLLNVDALVWVMFADGQRQQIEASPGYAASAVATQGRAVFVPTDARTDLDSMGGFITVLSLPRLLEVLPDQLAAALDGDPATAGPVLQPAD